MDVLLEYRNPKTNILPFSLLESCRYDEFRSLFNVAKNIGVTPYADTIACPAMTVEKGSCVLRHHALSPKTSPW